jgi:hypothetical protein
VVFENGTAVDRALVSIDDGRFRQVAPAVFTVSDGTFDFDAHAGLSYRVNASYSVTEPDFKQVSRRSDAFVVSGDTTITIVLPRPQ